MLLLRKKTATVEQCARKFRDVWVCRPRSWHEWRKLITVSGQWSWLLCSV